MLHYRVSPSPLARLKRSLARTDPFIFAFVQGTLIKSRFVLNFYTFNDKQIILRLTLKLE